MKMMPHFQSPQYWFCYNQAQNSINFLLYQDQFHNTDTIKSLNKSLFNNMENSMNVISNHWHCPLQLLLLSSPCSKHGPLPNRTASFISSCLTYLLSTSSSLKECVSSTGNCYLHLKNGDLKWQNYNFRTNNNKKETGMKFKQHSTLYFTVEFTHCVSVALACRQQTYCK